MSAAVEGYCTAPEAIPPRLEDHSLTFSCFCDLLRWRTVTGLQIITMSTCFFSSCERPSASRIFCGQRSRPSQRRILGGLTFFGTQACQFQQDGGTSSTNNAVKPTKRSMSLVSIEPEFSTPPHSQSKHLVSDSPHRIGTFCSFSPSAVTQRCFGAAMARPFFLIADLVSRQGLPT